MSRRILVISGNIDSEIEIFCQELLRMKDFNLKYPISTTSRQPRANEIEDIHYHFITPDAFRNKITNGEFVEYEKVYGSIYYGIEDKELNVDKYNIIISTSPENALKIKERYKSDCLSLYVKSAFEPELFDSFKEDLCSICPYSIGSQTDGLKTMNQLLSEFDYVCESKGNGTFSNIHDILAGINYFLDKDSIILDSRRDGEYAIGMILSEVSKYFQSVPNSNVIFRGVTAFYNNTNSDGYTHVIESGLQVRLGISGYSTEKDSCNYLHNILNEARRLFPKTYIGNDLEILSDIQHHGGATCLIDFSSNILTALWFACQGDFDKTAYLYCFNISDDIKNNILMEIDSEKVGDQPIGDILNKSIINDGIDICPKYFLWYPKAINNRIVRQDSVFIFGIYPIVISKHDIKVIALPKEIKKKINKTLSTYFNITENTIYNDPVGFAMANGKFKPVNMILSN